VCHDVAVTSVRTEVCHVAANDSDLASVSVRTHSAPRRLAPSSGAVSLSIFSAVDQQSVAFCLLLVGDHVIIDVTS